MNQSEPAPKASTSLDPAASGEELELRARIEHTRTELGETVEQLATKADVKAQARAAATRLSTQAKSATVELGQKAGAWSTADSARQLILPAVVTATAIVCTWLLLARRRGR
jgi:hypothetical protein